MALSTYTSKSLEDVIGESKGNPYMMHICFFKNRTKTLEIIQRAEGNFQRSHYFVTYIELIHVVVAGYKSIMVSVDVAALGVRLNEYRNDFKLPAGINNVLLSDSSGALPDDPDQLAWDATLTWEESIRWLRSHTQLEIWLKGSESPADFLFGKLLNDVSSSPHSRRRVLSD